MKSNKGDKHICLECETRFFDFGKNPATCPKCETVVANAKPTKQAKNKASVEPVAVVEPTPAPENAPSKDEDDDAIDVDLDIEEDESDDDDDDDSLMEDASDLSDVDDDIPAAIVPAESSDG